MPRLPRLRRSPARVVVAATAAVLLGACGGGATPAASTGGTPGPTAPEATAPATPTPEPPSGSPATTSPTTTTIPWGTIWDAVPADFPVPDAAEPTELNEPISAAWVRGGRRVAIADGMKTGLEAAGWSVEAASELEDGTVVLDAVKGLPECRAQVRVEPRGDQVFVIVLYAAACPWS